MKKLPKKKKGAAKLQNCEDDERFRQPDIYRQLDQRKAISREGLQMGASSIANV